MDRARSFAFVKQVPRRTVQEVNYHDAVYDRQVLLNESWETFCYRTGRHPVDSRPPHIIKHSFLRGHKDERTTPEVNELVEHAVTAAHENVKTEIEARNPRHKRTTYHFENFDVNHPGQADAQDEQPVKNVTETWEEYLLRVTEREHTIHVNDARSDRHFAAETKCKKQRAEISVNVMEQLRAQELQRQQKYLTPVQHSLLLDFAALKAARMAAEYAATADEEQRARHELVEQVEIMERLLLERAALDDEAAVRAELRRQRAEMEAALAAAQAEQKERQEAARQEAERRRKDELEAERRRKEAEEAAKKEERRRKEEERRARKAAEKKAARDGYKKPSGAINSLATTPTAVAEDVESPEEAATKAVATFWSAVYAARKKREDRMLASLGPYLDQLAERCNDICTIGEFKDLLTEVTTEIAGGGGLLYHTAVYIGHVIMTVGATQDVPVRGNHVVLGTEHEWISHCDTMQKLCQFFIQQHLSKSNESDHKKNDTDNQTHESMRNVSLGITVIDASDNCSDALHSGEAALPLFQPFQMLEAQKLNSEPKASKKSVTAATVLYGGGAAVLSEKLIQDSEDSRKQQHIEASLTCDNPGIAVIAQGATPRIDAAIASASSFFAAPIMSSDQLAVNIEPGEDQSSNRQRPSANISERFATLFDTYIHEGQRMHSVCCSLNADSFCDASSDPLAVVKLVLVADTLPPPYNKPDAHQTFYDGEELAEQDFDVMSIVSSSSSNGALVADPRAVTQAENILYGRSGGSTMDRATFRVHVASKMREHIEQQQQQHALGADGTRGDSCIHNPATYRLQKEVVVFLNQVACILSVVASRITRTIRNNSNQ